jgi:arylsulfatase
MGLTGGWSVGADPGAPVAPLYGSPFAFTGALYSVTVDVSGDVIKDDEAEFRMHMARQ